MTYMIEKYIQSIAMVIIFTSLVHLVTPSGDFKKYIKMILGLMIIVTILTPIDALFFRNKPNYIDILKKYEADIEHTTIRAQSGIYITMQNQMILENYKQKLMGQMSDVIEKSSNTKVAYLDIILNDDASSKEFGMIQAIDMTVVFLEDNETPHKIMIPQVKIGVKKNDKGSTVKNEGQIEKNIKTCLNDFYNLSDVNINITVQKNS